MPEPIERLEDRVDQALARLRQLADERNGLQSEVRELRDELERRDMTAVESAAAATDDGLSREDREAVLTSLRRALDELRAE